MVLSFKVQSPSHQYEFYILEKLHERMQELQCVADMVQDQSFTVDHCLGLYCCRDEALCLLTL